MYRRTRTRSSRGQTLVSLRPLRVEPLEDRRMLSILFVDAEVAPGGDGAGW